MTMAPTTEKKDIPSPADAAMVELTFETDLSGLPDLQRSQTRSSLASTIVRRDYTPSFQRLISPFTWSTPRKLTVLLISCTAGMLAAYSAGSYAMAIDRITQEWHISTEAAQVGISVFVLGFAFAPMILAPFSEVKGRYWVFVGAGVTFLLGTLGCAVTQSFAGMIVCRFIVGNGASVFATLVGGVISDLYHKEDRNTPMTMYSLAIMIGTGLGPLISGVISDRTTWRWIFYLQMITVGATTLIIALFFRETRENVILQRKVVALNTHLEYLEAQGLAVGGAQLGLDISSSRIRFYAPAEKRRSLPAMAWHSFKFPFHLLFTESVVFWFSLWVSFAWAILYMQFSSIGIVFRSSHGFSNTQIGAVFTAVIVGSALVTVVSLYQERLAARIWPKITTTPEGRLYFACIQSAFLPIGLFWFGWTSSPSVPWIVPTLAIASCTIGIFSIYLACFNYLADTYHRYASSALAAQSMCRNILAGVFALITKYMLTNLTYPGAGSLLGGIGVLLTAVPWVLCFYGERIRSRSPFAGELMMNMQK